MKLDRKALREKYKLLLDIEYLEEAIDSVKRGQNICLQYSNTAHKFSSKAATEKFTELFETLKAQLEKELDAE